MRWLVEWWPSRYLQCISSNYSVQEVKEILGICEKNGWVKPPVYQGQYNPAVRSREDSLSQSRGNMAFLSTHTGRCHAQRPPLNTTTNVSLSPASGGLFSGAYKNPPTPIAGINLYAPRPA